MLADKTAEIESQDQPIDEAIKLFIAESRSRQSSDNTISTYERHLGPMEAFLKSRGIAGVKEIKTAHLTQFIHGERLHFKPHTKNSAISILKNWLNFCVRQDWIEKNPAADDKLKRIPVNGFCRTALNQIEVGRIRAAIERLSEPDRTELRALFLLLIYTGLRISDAITLRRASINWKTGQLGPITIIKTKKEFEVALHPEAVAALRKLPVEGERFFASGAIGISGYQDCTRELVEVMSAALGKRITPHWLRDTFAVNLLEAGADIYDVSQLLGHSSVEITQQRYVSRTPKERIAAALSKLHYAVPAKQGGPAKLKRVS